MCPNITECLRIFSTLPVTTFECVGFEATDNIFTEHDVTEEIDRTCLAAHLLQHGH